MFLLQQYRRESGADHRSERRSSRVRQMTTTWTVATTCIVLWSLLRWRAVVSSTTMSATITLSTAPEYTVTRHSKWLYDEPTVAPRRVAHIRPLTLAEANVASPNRAVAVRNLTVDLSHKTRRLLRSAIFGKAGEFDENVLKLCRTGLMNKCSLYVHSEWADSVALCSDNDILSGEPIGCIMGRLREKSSLADSSSLATLTAVHIPSRQLPSSYHRGGGADLFIDTSSECNELAYIRDPRNSFLHENGGANCQARIVWNGEDGLVYLTVVALCFIPAHSELLMVDTKLRSNRTDATRTQRQTLALAAQIRGGAASNTRRSCSHTASSPAR